MNTENAPAKAQSKEEFEKEVADLCDLAFKAGGDYLKAKGITRGLTGAAHAGLIAYALVDLGLLPEENKKLTFHVLCRLENGSALRQRYEKEKLLGRDALAASCEP
jgi:hypothetical protein